MGRQIETRKHTEKPNKTNSDRSKNVDPMPDLILFYQTATEAGTESFDQSVMVQRHTFSVSVYGCM